MDMIKKPELLAPAGNFEKLRIAIKYGADAVYIAGKSLSLRTSAGNFSKEQLKSGIDFVHQHGKKVYIAVNIFANNQDLEKADEYLSFLAYLKADALIISDPGLFMLAQKYAPNIPIHISTQANNTNWQTGQFWHKLGAKRMVLARELTLSEAKEISLKGGLETEIFVHGAMCMAYSGRCLLSSFLTGRNANQGDCSHPCRWEYRVLEEAKRPGQFFPLAQDSRGSYIFNSKDLCLIECMPEIFQARINSLKIEGRMKSAFYIANTVRIYRQAIDSCWNDPENYQVEPKWLDALRKISHRQYTLGFAHGYPSTDTIKYDSSDYIRAYDFAGLVLNYDFNLGCALVEQRNHLALGDEVEIITPDGAEKKLTIEALLDEEQNPVKAVPHAKQKFYLPLKEALPAYAIIYRKVK